MADSTTMEPLAAETSATAAATVALQDLVSDESLVEEVSIDGMCGVY